MGSNAEFKEKLKYRSYQLAKNTITLVDKFPKKRASWVVTDQLLRSATSIGANIIEAQATSSGKDFVNFIHHSFKSGNETLFWLKLSQELDAKLVKDIGNLEAETLELVKILNSSILTLKGRKNV